jgi:hypothetical protein
VSKYTNEEKSLIQNIVATLTIKRVPESGIMKQVFKETGKTISRKSLWYVKQRIKRDSYKWYSLLRQGEYEYIHEFKSRVDEIVDLQRRHYQIIDDNSDRPTVQQTSLAALHKLSITLSNLYNFIPFMSNTVAAGLTALGGPLDVNNNVNNVRNNYYDGSEFKLERGTNCNCGPRDISCHYRCRYCGTAWCPKEGKKGEVQDMCPNPNCTNGIRNNHFEPYDELHKWIKCSKCQRWFKTDKILAIHPCRPVSNLNSE